MDKKPLPTKKRHSMTPTEITEAKLRMFGALVDRSLHSRSGPTQSAANIATDTNAAFDILFKEEA